MAHVAAWKTAASLRFVFRRSFSAFSGPPSECFIMGVNGPICLPGYGWADLVPFFMKNPLVHVAPEGRLFAFGTRFMDDDTRDLLQTAVHLPVFSDDNGISFAGAYHSGNVGVLQHLNTFAYKSLVKDNVNIWSVCGGGLLECAYFMDGLFKLDPTRPLFVPPDVARVIDSLTWRGQNREIMLNQPAFYSDLEYGEMSFEVHRIARQQCRVWDRQLGKTIVKWIGRTHTSHLPILQSHPVSNAFLSESFKSKRYPSLVKPTSQTTAAGTSTSQTTAAGTSTSQTTAAGTSTSPTTLLSEEQTIWLRGVALIDANRNGPVHSVEPAIEFAIKTYLPPWRTENFRFDPVRREEIIQMMRSVLPDLVPDVYDCLEHYGKLELLQLESRFPTSTILKVI